jgi:hypothetical protein
MTERTAAPAVAKDARTPKESAKFSLERFELYTSRRQREKAALELIKLLTHLDANYGQLGVIGEMPSGDLTSDQRDTHYATRIASAVASLFADPEFHLSGIGFNRMIGLQNWLATLFGASAFGHADHVIHLLNKQGHASQLTFDDRDLLKFYLLYSPDSLIPLQPEVHWRKNKTLAAAFFLAMLSSRLVLTRPAHQKRELLLEWLPARLSEVSLDQLPLETMHHVWMHCSYAERKDKHSIKRALNQLLRAKLLALNLGDVQATPPAGRDKPVLMCVVEWFLSNHSIYRTHSVSLEALKSKYRLVGVSLRGASDEITRRVFDEVHVVQRGAGVIDSVKQVRTLATKLAPELVYYPSIGMFPESIFLANLRLAPIQFAALGHPATTHSSSIDYVLVEEDYLGDPACFSERVVALPKEAIPYRPPASCPVIAPEIRKSPDTIRVAVAASVMKINPNFLATLRRIADKSKVRLEFHFYSLLAYGLGKMYLQNVVQRFLPDWSVVNPNLPYERYLENLNRCDMFVNPFPFGNTNGIVDAVRQALPGICLTGPEVHTHIDEGLFKRLGLPSWTVAKSVDEYVTAVVRLAENSGEREEIARRLQKINPDDILFKGDATLFAESVQWLQRTHEEHKAIPGGQVLRPPLSAGRAPAAAGKAAPKASEPRKKPAKRR